MNKNISNKLKRPLYVNVYDELLLQFKKGKYPIGSRLPSEPDLAKELGISRSTLRQAMALLQDDGIVRNEHGKGNFLIDSFFKQQETVPLDGLSNPVHKYHISIFDQVEINYGLESATEYTNQVLKEDASEVVALERLYRKGSDLIAYAFTFMSMQTVKSFSLNLDDKEQVLDFLENAVYVNANHGEIEIKHTNTVNLSTQKEKLIGRNEYFLLLESIYGNADYPLMHNKFYIPQQFAKIKLTISK
ncbi:GntR family transcriptional regulator [Sporosarcina beigongshangi]|uniref:GntR family transcriptional regulator n=1 Tax=Sporosarcina beigongshangi TaxID=2782538 RepID=UPI00193AA542|nr:GntR family transcriptional regulator [Sporosarcina beigongshangi]